jgi:hypothetical protein
LVRVEPGRSTRTARRDGVDPPEHLQRIPRKPITLFYSENGFIPVRADLSDLSGEIDIGASGQVSADTTALP